VPPSADSTFGMPGAMAEAPTPVGAAPIATAPLGAPTAAAAAPMSVPGANTTITPVAIAAGGDTGTAVNKTIQSLRNQVVGVEQKLASDAQRLTDLRNNGANAAGSYQQYKAQITTRLQIGTTKGNPELVAQWNSAQASLDALSANINQLNALG